MARNKQNICNYSAMHEGGVEQWEKDWKETTDTIWANSKKERTWEIYRDSHSCAVKGVARREEE